MGGDTPTKCMGTNEHSCVPTVFYGKTIYQYIVNSCRGWGPIHWYSNCAAERPTRNRPETDPKQPKMCWNRKIWGSDSGALIEFKLYIKRIQCFSLRPGDKKARKSILWTFSMVSSVLVAKPPIFSIQYLQGLRGHILSNILSILAGDAGNIQYQ